MQANPMKDKSTLQLSDLSNSKQTLINDRLWFKQHLGAVVRFRPEIDQEFAPLLRHGSTPPQFIPSHLKKSLPFNWVVVVHLQRMLGISDTEAEIGQMRLRIQTIATPQLKDQRLAEKELTRAIAKELLINADQNHMVVNEQHPTDTHSSEAQAA